jgi:hypothetical protein
VELHLSPLREVEVKLPKIAEIAREQARFVKYEDGKLWYQVIWTEHDANGAPVRPHLFDFPIDITKNDTGGTFGNSERAVMFLRWIRQHLEFLREARDASELSK